MFALCYKILKNQLCKSTTDLSLHLKYEIFFFFHKEMERTQDKKKWFLYKWLWLRAAYQDLASAVSMLTKWHHWPLMICDSHCISIVWNQHYPPTPSSYTWKTIYQLCLMRPEMTQSLTGLWIYWCLDLLLALSQSKFSAQFYVTHTTPHATNRKLQLHSLKSSDYNV